MGHKHSTLHRQLKQQDVPSHDLVTATDSGGGGGSGNNASPYFEVKQGPFRRKLSVRNISIRRSFHMSKKHTRLNKVSATTDDIKLNSNSNSSISAQASSSHAVPNGTVPTDLVSSSCGTGSQVPSTSTPTPVSLPRAASTNRNGDKYVMDRLRKSFRNSFRRKKDHIPESIKPHQWQSDEAAVKSGNCIFSVKYLGCVEVFESRGMQICEDALRRLRNSRRRPTKGTLYVTGDGLRVVDDETKGLIVDQTIEKVSFCAPDRSHERGFSYICRDGTTRRWMCHGFHATKDSGERLSHAVGCAFSVCLERKQRRDKEAVNSVFDVKTATFTRTGSFRQSSITERMQDPQVAKPTEPPPLKPVHNPYAVERPHAAASLLQRQGSLRGGPLNQVSPFKRQLSLRLGIDTLPTLLSTNVSNSSITNSSSTSSNQRERERAHSLDLTTSLENNNNTNTPAKRSVPNSLFPSKVTLTPSVAPIEEVSPSYDKASNSILTQPSQGTSSAMNPAESSIITAMCQELSQGLTMLAAKTEEDLHIENNNSFSSWSPGHFSPSAALGIASNESSNTSTSFSAFDKWISTNNGYKKPPDVKPLVPPPVVDQMPQVTAPPPPSSPSYSTTFSSQFNTKMTVSSKPTDYHSSLFSDLTNTLKDNLSSSIKPTSSVSSSVQIVPAATSSTSTTFESISVLSKSTIPNINGSSTTNGGSHLFNSDKSTSNSIDPFDAGWAELSNRHLHDETKKSMTTFCNDATTTVTSSIPFKSTNPFLDLSQYETASTTSSGSANSVVASTQSTQPQQQMFKAFEVHM